MAGSTIGSLSGSSSGREDAFVRMYDLKENELWTQQFGTAALDAATSLAIDAEGNIIVIGNTWGSLSGSSAGDYDVFVMIYKP